jgi:hypothetical protein
VKSGTFFYLGTKCSEDHEATFLDVNALEAPKFMEMGLLQHWHHQTHIQPLPLRTITTSAASSGLMRWRPFTFRSLPIGRMVSRY